MSGSLLSSAALALRHAKKRPNKPLMERKRRERINNSLDQLKSLVMSAMNKENTRPSKVEKADILEMSVRYLKNLQANNMKEKYLKGYNECLQEVTSYLDQASCVSKEVGERLRNHLSKYMCSKSKQELACLSTQQPHNIKRIVKSTPTAVVASNNNVKKEMPIANNAVPVMAGFLPNGQLALFLSQAKQSVSPKEAPHPTCSSTESSSTDQQLNEASIKQEQTNSQENMWRPW